ncbi:MAG: hypothetical protein GC190_16560 [Alphaproteobacteria bacterium]|nr:hypothetical protein [Alphaproteobacteria bacterium]
MVRIMHSAAALALLVGAIVLSARGATPSPAMQADAAFQAQNWQTAATLYGQLVKEKDSAGINWFRLGYALVKLRRDSEALAAFQDGEKHGLPKPSVEFGLGLAYGRSDRDKAFAHLQAAASNGFNDTKKLQTEEALAPLRSDARFAKVIETVRRNEKPCLYAPESRQFDFWIGNWSVVRTGTDAPQVGTSHIELVQNSCVVLENWTSMNNPYAGQSFNVFNTALKRWEQYWVDNSGGMIFFHGGLKNNVMDYWTDDVPKPDGRKLRRHLQFFNLDRDTVRQFSQGSYDGGKTWFVEYDLTYHRLPKHASGPRRHMRDALLVDMKPETRL